MIEEYKRLIDEYHRVIHSPGWHLGPQQELSDKLAACHGRMSKADQVAGELYAREVWNTLVGNPKGA